MYDESENKQLNFVSRAEAEKYFNFKVNEILGKVSLASDYTITMKVKAGKDSFNDYAIFYAKENCMIEERFALNCYEYFSSYIVSYRHYFNKKYYKER